MDVRWVNWPAMIGVVKKDIVWFKD